MALAFVFFIFLVIHFASAQDAQGSVQLYSDDGCSGPTGLPISLLTEDCLETDNVTAIAIDSLPSCANGSPVLYISDLNKCQKPSFFPLISSDTVGECLFFATGSGIDSAHFDCSADYTTAITGQVAVSQTASSSLLTIPAGLSVSPTTSSQIPTVEIISAGATTSSAPNIIPTAQSPEDQSTDTSSGLSLTNKIALGCGIGIGLPTVILGYLNWRKRSPEPPPPYSPYDFEN
jgi:hypothetical protein